MLHNTTRFAGVNIEQLQRDATDARAQCKLGTSNAIKDTVVSICLIPDGSLALVQSAQVHHLSLRAAFMSFNES
jgi:hypothetical protein